MEEEKMQLNKCFDCENDYASTINSCFFFLRSQNHIVLSVPSIGWIANYVEHDYHQFAMGHSATRELEYILEPNIRPVHKLSVIHIFLRGLCIYVCLPVYNPAQCPMEHYARACLRLFLRHNANQMKRKKPVFRFFFASRESLTRRIAFNGQNQIYA